MVTKYKLESAVPLGLKKIISLKSQTLQDRNGSENRVPLIRIIIFPIILTGPILPMAQSHIFRNHVFPGSSGYCNIELLLAISWRWDIEKKSS